MSCIILKGALSCSGLIMLGKPGTKITINARDSFCFLDAWRISTCLKWLAMAIYSRLVSSKASENMHKAQCAHLLS